MKENVDPELWRNSVRFCGIDEVGRGALAGPVVAAAVMLPRHCDVPGADDSKRLTPNSRLRLDSLIRRYAVAVGLGASGPRTIDRINIRRATMRAMRIAFARLNCTVQMALVDGDAVPNLDCQCLPLVGGDRRSLSIACASIVAKVFRDRLMARVASRHPDYGFEANAGYGTPRHLAALRDIGPSPLHRRSFAPLRDGRPTNG